MPAVEDKARSDFIKFCEKFGHLQEQRVLAYSKLERGHREYLQSGPTYDFPTFRKLVYDVTCEFKQISEDILNVMKELNLNPTKEAKEVAGLIAKVQEKEQIQLEKTAEHFLGQEDVKDEHFGDSAYLDSKVLEYKKDLAELRNSITEEVEEIRLIRMDL